MKNGVLIRPWRQLYCWLIEGHEYVRVSPEYQGKAVFQCRKCLRERVF